MKRLVLFSTIILLLAACHSSHPTVASTNAPTAETPTSDATPLPSTTYTVTNFNAEVEGLRTSGQLRIAKDSILWVAVYRIVELGRAKATPDSVFVSAPLAGRHFAGSYADLQRITHQSLDFHTLQDLLTGDNPSKQLALLAAQLGLKVSISLGTPRQVDHIEFPFYSR